MTRGLFAGAFWGLLTGGLVLTVAALVLDHRDSQPVPVPTRLANVIGTGPVADWDMPVARVNVTRLRIDPPLDPADRKNRRVHEIAPPVAPQGLQSVSPTPLVLSTTVAAGDFGLVLFDEVLKIDTENQDAALDRTAPFQPVRPDISAAATVLGFITPLPEKAPIVASSLLFPEAPNVSSFVVRSPQNEGELTRSDYAVILTDPAVARAPRPVEDAAISAPKDVGLSSVQTLSQQPSAATDLASKSTNVSERQDEKPVELSRIQSRLSAKSPPRSLSYPPLGAAHSESVGEVIVILLSNDNFEGPIPDWAAGVATTQSGVALDRPVFAVVPLDASAAQIVEAQAQLNALGDGAGVIVLPSVSEGRPGSQDLASLISQAPMALGAVEALAIAPKLHPVYRWTQGEEGAVLQDLAAAQARASRDGQSIVVVQDSPAARDAVAAWENALDPTKIKFGRLPFSGS